MREEERSTTASPTASGRAWRRWHFAGCHLDERTLEFVVKGTDVELERKPLEVLTYLLQHAGEVCTKDELLAGVWPGRVLSDTVLTKCIGRLRDALGDEQQAIIKTAYGFGYRLIAPVQIETIAAPEPVRFGFNPGDHLPSRPLWRLVERLGVGGHGEAWRVRHDKTHEQRVFKFALDESSLGALKREITLFRVINDTLGERAPVIKLLDWNLAQAPYFVEMEYAAGGSLVDWVRARGGTTAVPVPERIEIIAKIAAALAAVHSVGVLHKDLKPSNVLIDTGGDSIEVLLADFGSGALLDPACMERMGITRLGFTRTVAASEANLGTPLYLAPEILAGQPFTVKSDVYALGVIFYQFLSGDFHQVMSPGWERHIEDELLREDIAAIAEGNPAMRLADADVLARRLRSLDERRTQLALQREARAKAERTRRLLERARARRFGLMVAFGVLIAGLVVSTALYLEARRAQQRSAIAAARSNAVVEFLGNDVFAPLSSGNEPVKDMHVLTMLERAGSEVDTRFAAQPDIASQVHFVIGRSFQSLYDSAQAVRHFRRALELGQDLDGEGSESALRSASELVQIDYLLGGLRESLPRYEAILAAGQKLLPADSAAVLNLRLRLARGRYFLGEWVHAERDFALLATDITSTAAAGSDFAGRVAFHRGQVLIDLARPAEAQVQLRAAIDSLSSSLGEEHGMVAEARAALGRALGDSGRYAEAAAELVRAEELAARWAAPDTWTAVRPRYFSALLLMQQDVPDKAEVIVAGIVSFQDTNRAAYVAARPDATPELDHTGPVRQALGEAYARQGKFAEAADTLRRAIDISEKADGYLHPTVISTRLSLAECLLLAGGPDAEIQRLLSAAPESALAGLPQLHPIHAQRYRVAGLLARRQQSAAIARESLSASLDIYQSLYGPKHWRVVRARQELSGGGP